MSQTLFSFFPVSKSTTGLPQAEPLDLVQPGQRLSMKDKPWGPLMLASGCHPSVMVGPPHGSVNLDELLPLSGLQFLTCGVMAPALDRLCELALTMSGTPHTRSTWARQLPEPQQQRASLL